MLAAPRLALTASVLLLGTLSFPACTSSGSGGGATASDYCATLSNYVTKCHITDPCITASVQQCSTAASAYSPAALTAVISCVGDAACGDAGLGSLPACIQQKQAAATPSAAQSKLAQDYCAICPRPNQTATDCVARFYTGAVANEAGTTVGPGNGLFNLNDSVTGSIDSQCIPKIAADAGFFGCAFTFETCSLGVVLAAVGTAPAACGSSLVDAGAPGPGTDGG